VYKEVSDPTLLGTIQATAVHWSGIITIFDTFLSWKAWEILHFVENVFRTVTVEFIQCI